MEKQQRSAAEVSRAELGNHSGGAVVVEIYDQVYQLSGIDAEHIERLAATVDNKMRMVSAAGATVDSLRVAVLASLNIADELAQVQARCLTLQDQLREARLAQQDDSVSPSEIASVQSRTGSLLGMLDAVLEDRMAS